MFARIRNKTVALMLSVLMCVTMLPFSVLPRAEGLTPEEMEPYIMLSENTHQGVTEIPAGKPFNISGYWGSPDKLISVSLINESGDREYVLYKDDQVFYGGRYGNEEEGPYYMVGFSAASFVPGVYYLLVHATDGDCRSNETITIVADGSVKTPPEITTTALPDAKQGEAYAFTLKATPQYGGSITWSVAGGSLPSGLKLDAATGKLSGAPAVSGRVSFSVTAEEAGGGKETVKLELNIAFVPFCTVQFHLDGGSVPTGADYGTKTVKEGAGVTLPAAPTRSGFHFVGWKTGNDVYLPGAAYTVKNDVTFTAEWTAIAPLTVGLPAQFPAVAGSLWLEGETGGNSVILWRNFFEGSGAPEIQIDPYYLSGWRYSKLSLYGYVNGEPTVLATAGSVDENTKSVTLTASGAKWTVVKGVRVNGLTENTDYTLGNVTWSASGKTGYAPRFPYMARTDNTYTVRLLFDRGGYYNGDLRVSDVYTVSALSGGYLTITPKKYAEAEVKGAITIDGTEAAHYPFGASQTVNGYTHTVIFRTDYNGNYTIRLLSGVPVTFFTRVDDDQPYFVSGETLASPKAGQTHNIVLKRVKVTADVSFTSVSDAGTTGRYISAYRGSSFLLRLVGAKGQVYPASYGYYEFSETLSEKRTITAWTFSPDEAGTLTMTPEDRDGAVFGSVSAQVKCKGGAGSAKLQAELHAGVVAPLSADVTGKYILVWYDAAGNYIGKSNETYLYRTRYDIPAACPTETAKGYTLVLTPATYNSEELLSASKLSALPKEQAIARWKVDLKKSQIKVLSEFKVDSVSSENALYVTKPHSTLSVSRTGFSGTNDLISFYGSVGLDAGLPNGLISGLVLNTGNIAAPTMIPEMITINGASYPFRASHGKYTVDLSALAGGGIPLPCNYTIYGKPYAADTDMLLELEAKVSYTGGRLQSQPVGTATVARPGASIRTYSQTVSKNTVRLSGTALPKERVEIYDNGISIGRATANESGLWQGSFPLAGTSPKFTTRHTLRAVTASGVRSGECTVTHRSDGPELRSLTMQYENKKPIPLGGSYSVAQTMRDVKFRAEFSNPDQLDDLPGFNSKVVLRVFLGNGEVRFLEMTQGKDGVFAASIDFISGYIAAVEPIFSAKAGPSYAAENKDGSLTCAADSELTAAFSEVASVLRGTVAVQNGKAVYSGKTQADNYAVKFSGGKATMSGNVKGVVKGVSAEELRAAYETAAAELSASKLTAKDYTVNYRNTRNLMEWINEAGEEQAAANKAAGKNAKANFYTRNNLFGDRTSFLNAKNTVEKYAVNTAWSENADGKNHRKLTLGKNQTFDTYVLTDCKYNDDGSPAAGTYNIQISFFSDTSASPAVYLANATAIYTGAFRGYAGLKDGAAALPQKAGILSLFTIRANAWEESIYSSYNGHFSEDSAYAEYCKMEDSTGFFSMTTGSAGSFIALSSGGPGAQALGSYFSLGSLSASIYNLGAILKNNGYRIQNRVFMDADLRRLIESPCYKRLNDSQKQMCDHAYEKFKKAAEKADNTDTSITGVSVGLCGGGIGASAIGIVCKAASKPAAKAGLVISGAGVAMSAGTAGAIDSTRQEMIRQYEESYKTITSIILGHSARTNSDDCKKVKTKFGERITYNVSFDPAGVVYEGVIENPVENALVTLWYGVDANGKPVKEPDIKQVKRVIPAADVTEKSPVETTQMTGEDGRYQWFVPEGLWFVTARSGKMTGSSNADLAAKARVSGVNADGLPVTNLLPVLPVQLDVNIPLVDPSAPTVKSVRCTEEGIIVEFSKYMVDSAGGADSVLNAANYALSNAGGAIAIAGVQAVEQGHTPANIDGKNVKTYTRTVRIKTKTALKAGDTVLLCVKKRVKSYAGTAMAADAVESGVVSSQSALPAPVIAGGAKQTLAFGSPLTVTLPKGAPENAKIYYTVNGETPTEKSTLYTGPIGAEKNMTVKAVAVCPGYPNSAAASAVVTVAETLSFNLCGNAVSDGKLSPAGLTLTLSGNNVSKTAKVSADGGYRFEGLPAGSYTVKFAGNADFAAAEAAVTVSTADPWVTLQLTEKNKTPDYTPGDVDFSGDISAADARLALRRAVGLETYPEGSAAFLACDVDSDGEVTAGDARLILRAAVGLEDASQWKKK